MTKMNQGVEMVLARMESHPHEFALRINADGGLIANPPRGRWDWLMNKILLRKSNQTTYEYAFLTDYEVSALYDKYMEIQGDEFTKRVMAELLSADQLDASGF